MKNNDNPIAFLEKYFQTMKDYLESGKSPDAMAFSTEFIRALEQETRTILTLCSELNSDDDFVDRINALTGQRGTNGLLLKAEHFFVSDLIAAYNSNPGPETDISRFVLAYYYDALRNNQFADANAAGMLNKLVAADEFKAHFDRIRSGNVLTPADIKYGPYFLPVVMKQKGDARLDNTLKISERFLGFSFGKKFADEKELLSFLKLDLKAVKSTGRAMGIPEDDSLEKVMKELNELVGMDNIKKDIEELINLLEVQKKRSKQGLKNIEITLHTVFLGPPGTGKTSVARLLSRIFKHLGFLSKGQLCETDREGMVAGYVGQTATKVDKIVQESLGGVLFIDEAYALTNNPLGNDYGGEAVNILLKRMEDHRDDLAVIVAGYTEPMKLFVESNPGLRSRFNRFFHFKDFTPAELLEIFEGLCKKSDFTLSEDAKEKLTDTFELLYSKKDEGFGNARVVRNLFEKCVQNQANRIIKLKKISNAVLKKFEEADIPEPKETEEQVYYT